MAGPVSAKATLATPLSSDAVAAHAAAVPEIVAPAAGALNETLGATLAVVVVPPVVVPPVVVPPVVVPVLLMLTLITSERVAPELSVAVALSECVPLANFVVSRAHCMPSVGVESVLSGVLSRKKATLETLPEAFT